MEFLEFLGGVLLVLSSPIWAAAGVIVILFLWGNFIKFILFLLAHVERLWNGTMFLGFVSYESPGDRWYRLPNGEWGDRQYDNAQRIRPGNSLDFDQQHANYLKACDRLNGYQTQIDLELSSAMKEVDDFLAENTVKKEELH